MRYANAIKPELVTRIYWTMVSVDILVLLGATRAFTHPFSCASDKRANLMNLFNLAEGRESGSGMGYRHARRETTTVMSQEIVKK